MVGAGLAGFDSELDNKWALEFLKYPGLNCPKIIVNDSRVSHEITFNFGPGIIAIEGNRKQYEAPLVFYSIQVF